MHAVPIHCVYAPNGVRLTEKNASKELRAFDCISHYTAWTARVKDHCQSVSAGWLRILFIAKRGSRILKWNCLMSTNIDTRVGQQTLELSLMPWSFIKTLVTDLLHRRCNALAGGDEGNGFELWQIRCHEHQGGAMQCKTRGILGFHAFPECEHLKDLNVHNGGWLVSR